MTGLCFSGLCIAACAVGAPRSPRVASTTAAASASSAGAVAPPKSSTAPPQQPPASTRPEDELDLASESRDDSSFDFEPDVEEAIDAPILDGTGPISTLISRAIEPYLQARRARLAAITADGKSMLVLTRLSDTTQVHLLRGPMSARQQMTFGRDPVQQAAFAEGERAILYRADHGGDEDYQIYQLTLSTQRVHKLTDGKSRHGPFRLAPDGERFAFTSNAQNQVDMDFYIGNRKSRLAEKIEDLRGQWVALGWSRDGRYIVLQQYQARDRSTLHLYDVQGGSMRALHPLERGTSFKMGMFGATSKRLYAVTNRESDVERVQQYDVDTDTWQPLTQNTRFPVEGLAVSASGSTLATVTNEDGASVLRLIDANTGHLRRKPTLPSGQISELRFYGRGENLAFSLTTATEPQDAYSLDLQQGALLRWTHSEVGGIPTRRFTAPELVRIKSFDGLSVPAYYYRPKGDGPFPVLIWVHGGPEEQFRPGFDPMLQYFVAELKVAVLAPNIRGSDGYGQRYLSLDDGRNRTDTLKDVAALLDWIERRPELRASHVGIYGASYGGWVVLASLIEYGDRLRAGCDLVGISNIVSFLENTRDYRRDLRRHEYGDERDPAMRQYLDSISPLHRANEIKSALFVAHGANDPRVPASEARQIVDAARAAGSDVWFMLANSEGHGFRNRRNRDIFYKLMAAFFDRHLNDAAVPKPRAAVPELRATPMSSQPGTALTQPVSG